MLRSTAAYVLVVLLAALAILPQSALAKSQAEELEGENYLPIGLTDEERENLDRIGEAHRSTPPPTEPVRNPGEFEPMTGVIVRYPFGNPTGLLVEYAEDDTLWVIVEDSADQASATSTLQSGGCDMSHVGWIFAPTNSIWTRDYGPWFVITGNDEQGIVDHIYNRPRPDDDLIPGVIGSDWGVPVYGMDLEHTGGNYMSDGRGVAMSTRLVIDENTSLTTTEIDSIMNDYLGIERYEKLPYIESGGIHHIDCWAKFLSPQKILVKEVPTSHSSYDELEANVAYLESQSGSWGRPYEVVRVYCPNDEPYTNSLILNDKVFVPQYGTSWDDDAIATYEAAMPGYEILGYSGSWYTNDAIHCRAMGVTDRYMLYIDHIPLNDSPSETDPYRVEADFVDYSEQGLKTDSLLVYWESDSSPGYTPIVMTEDVRSGSYYADIPAQSMGDEVRYYIFAADYSGRRETHPWVAPGDAHAFAIITDNEAPTITHTPLTDITVGQWPPTAVATVTDNTVVDSVELESWINGTPQTTVAMSETSPGVYEGTFAGTAASGDDVTYRIKASDAASPPNVTYDPSSGTHSFSVVDAIDVVIWEPDPSPISGAALMTGLASLGVSYDYTTGSMPNLDEYSAAFICLGVYSQNYSLSTSEANALTAYMDGGVSVYMEGGDCWAYDSSRTIYNGHFGVNGMSDGGADLSTVNGEAGTMCEGMSFAYTGANSYIDHMSATGSGVRIFTNPSDGAGCGVSNDAGTYKSVGCSFEFGGLTDGASPSTKEELLTEILTHFGIIETGVPGDGDALRFELSQNRPNPFNPATTVAFELPAAGEVELSVYNVAGRRVATLVDGRVDAGRHTAVWKGTDDRGESVASGVYFFRLTRDGESVSRKGVLLK
ncbi:MAG: T9SS type A sorting domain-containing protein [Candidatus Eisenbacteria bacterium]|nr:T9SS type A sorting domain-containing protein [Candidatus Eisenbacteria bacterium]